MAQKFDYLKTEKVLGKGLEITSKICCIDGVPYDGKLSRAV